MPFVPTPNCIQVELVHTWDGQVVENVVHYVRSAPWNLELMEEVAEQIVTQWNSIMKPLMPTTVSLILIRLTDMSDQEGPVLNFASLLPILGTNVSASLPNNCSVTITKRTAARGRSRRGRIYQIGLTEASVVANQVSGPAMAGYISFWTSIMALTITADEAIMVVNSTYSNGAPRSEGLATPVTNFTSDGFVDSQRRRLPGRGM